jgi:hypothetical protein
MRDVIFDSGVFDSTTGTFSNLVSGGDAATVVNSNCLTFNGVDNRLAMSQKETWFDDARNPWTIEFYYNPSNTGASGTLLSNKMLQKGLSIKLDTNLNILMTNVTTTDELRTRSVLACSNGVNALYTISYDGSLGYNGVKFYKNGVELTKVNTSNLTTYNITSLATTTYIGVEPLTTTPTFGSFLSGLLFGLKAWKSVQLPNTTVAPDLFDLSLQDGAGTLYYDKVSKLPSTMSGTLANINSVKQSLSFNNHLNGFSQVVQGNSAGYFITPYKTKTNTKIKAKYYLTNTVNTQLFGSYSGVANDRFALKAVTNGVFQVHYGSIFSTVKSTAAQSSIAEIEMTMNTIIINGVNTVLSGGTRADNTTNFLSLFVYNWNTGISQFKNISDYLYYFQIYEDDTLLYDYVPYYDGTLYDKLNKTYLAPTVAVNAPRIPNQQTDPTKDVFGQPLTNPPILNGLNLSENAITLPSSGVTDFKNISENPKYGVQILATPILNEVGVVIGYRNIKATKIKNT